MQKQNYEFIWKILREKNCEVFDNITKGMLCTICKNLMANPYSGRCGCRYCLECVTNYLRKNNIFCPGSTGDNCKDEFMIINETVLPDCAMNLEISKLNVKCPRDSCHFTGELRMMEEHERVCRKQATMCPYCHIGCQHRPLVNDKIEEHLAKENESHAKLLMDCIGRLQNEIQSMKHDITCLKEERQEQQMVVEQQVVKMEQMVQEILVLKDENRSMKEVMEIIGTENLELKSALEQKLAEMRGTLQKQAKYIAKLQKYDLTQDARLHQLEQQAINEQKDRHRHVDEAHKKQARGDVMTMSVRQRLINVENRTKGDFVWCIDEWAARRQAARDEWADRKRLVSSDDDLFEQVKSDDTTKVRIFSDTFCLHEQGYRMCLSAWPDGYYDNLVIVWRLVRGPFDQHLSWPFQGTVTLSLIDQETGQDFTSFTVSSDQYPNDENLNKPTSKRNYGLSTDNIISVEQLSRNPALCRNNQILVRCVVIMST